MSRNLLNLALLVTIMVLASILLWPPGQQDKAAINVSTLDVDDINRIHIQRNDLPDIQLQKQHDSWHMLSPYQVKADNTRVGALLRLADTTSHVRFSADDRELVNYGLDPSLAQVRFNDTLFEFGDLENISKRRYVLLDNNIHMVTDIYYYQLRTSPTHFVSPRLLNSKHNIRRLVLPGQEYTQQENGSWSARPAINELSADKLNSFIENWQRLRSGRIRKADVRTTDEHVSIELTDGSQVNFDIMRDESDVIFIRRDLGLQYYVSNQLADSLFTPPTPDITK